MGHNSKIHTKKEQPIMKKSFKLAIAAFASLLTLGGVSSTGFVAHAEETRVSPKVSNMTSGKLLTKGLKKLLVN